MLINRSEINTRTFAFELSRNIPWLQLLRHGWLLQ